MARGAVLLFAYSLGLGRALLALGAGMTRGTTARPAGCSTSGGSGSAAGILLVATGIGMITGTWTTLMSGMLGLYARLGWPPI